MSPSPPLPAPRPLADRFAGILQAVVGGVSMRVWRAPPLWGGVLIPLVLANMINAWIQQRRRRILDILARIEAGTQRMPRPYKAREGAPTPEVPRAAPRHRMPSRFAWLCALAQEVRQEGRYLGILLDEAEMKERMLAHPQLVRLVRPLLRMLGERDPAWMPVLPKQKRRRRGRSMPGAARSAGPPSGPDLSGALERLIDDALERYRRRVAAMQPVPAAPARVDVNPSLLPLGLRIAGAGGDASPGAWMAPQAGFSRRRLR